LLDVGPEEAAPAYAWVSSANHLARSTHVDIASVRLPFYVDHPFMFLFVDSGNHIRATILIVLLHTIPHYFRCIERHDSAFGSGPGPME
jgi:hypothetical protein